jgi:hypothetical protein
MVGSLKMSAAVRAARHIRQSAEEDGLAVFKGDMRQRIY